MMGPVGRMLVLRVYWDGQEQPSVECQLGDFFAAGWGGFDWSGHAQVSSLPVCVNPGSALSCYWEMPFRQHCRITIENRSAGEARFVSATIGNRVSASQEPAAATPRFSRASMAVEV